MTIFFLLKVYNLQLRYLCKELLKLIKLPRALPHLKVGATHVLLLIKECAWTHENPLVIHKSLSLSLPSCTSLGVLL